MSKYLVLALIVALLTASFYVQPLESTKNASGPVKPLQDEGHRPVGDTGTKVLLFFYIQNMSLVFCGDDANESEITISYSIEWKCPIAEARHHRFGNFGPHNQWQNGEFRDFTVEDYDGVRRGVLVYANLADCPLVPRELVVTFFVWECDGWNIWADILKVINEIVGDVANLKGIPIPTALIQQWLDDKKKKREDLGDFEGTIPFPDSDPCSLPPGSTVFKEGISNLTNIYRNVQLAQDKLGYVPAVIGQIGWRIELYSCRRWNSTEVETAHPLNQNIPKFVQPEKIDVGQPDEARISSTIKLFGGIPLSPLVNPGDWLSYEVFFDVDNRTSTGGSNGEEFKLTLSFETMDQIPEAKLLAWNETSGVYQEVAGGVYDYAISDDRDTVYLSTELEKLGNPAGYVASWIFVKGYINGTSYFDTLPDSAPAEAIFHASYYGFSGNPARALRITPPDRAFDVNRSQPISVEFNKAMNRTSVEAAFSTDPPVTGDFTWNGSTVTFIPSELLEPYTNYTVRINSTATDRVSTPLNDTVAFSFLTEGLPLYTCSATGKEEHEFAWKEPVYVTGTGFANNTIVDVCVVSHTVLLNGQPILSENVTTTTTNSTGGIPPIQVWNAPQRQFEREYNIVVDVDRDGLFQVGVDRVDFTDTGFTLKRHDVSITRACPLKTYVGQGYLVGFNATIANPGDFNQSLNVIICNESLASPSPSQNDTFYHAGDVNTDGYIDAIDLSLIAAENGWHGPAGQNPADLDEDGDVDVYDFSRAAVNQGKNVWTYFGLSPAPFAKLNVTLPWMSSAEVTIFWNTTGYAYGNYTIIMYACRVLNETYAGDNIYVDGWVFVNIPGEVNGDGVVNILDAIKLSNSFFSSPNSSNWNPNVDINGDGVVNIIDAIILANHFLQHYP